MKRNEKDIEEVLQESLPSASQEQIEAARSRVYDYSRTAAAIEDDGIDVPASHRVRRSWVPAMASLAAAILLGVWIVIPTPDRGPLAILESSESSVYRVADGDAIALSAGDPIQAGEIVRSNGGMGGVLALTDGSSVEMSSDSELQVHRADGGDGIGIRLLKGGIIVHAADRRSGRLYVQTKDATVSVVGTVFLVEAEEEGSRVAVIEGEVRVEQQSGTRRLLPGEQVATGRSMAPVAVAEEISWSRYAAAHRALLEEAIATLQRPQAPETIPERFEVVSIKPFVAQASANDGRGGGAAGGGAAGGPAGAPCGSSAPQVDQGRFFVANATTLRLIAWAYGIRDCREEIGIVSEGPDWIRQDRYEVEARIPAGATTYSRMQLANGEAPQLQRMLQSMLRDRFSLSLRRETRDMPVLELAVERPGRMQPSVNQSAPPDPFDPFAPGARLDLGPGGAPPPGTLILFVGNGVVQGTQISIPLLIQGLQARQTRLVIDKTGLKGFFDIRVPVSLDPAALPGTPPNTDAQVLNHLGLKLQPSRAPVEVFIIESIERPSDN